MASLLSFRSYHLRTGTEVGISPLAPLSLLGAKARSHFRRAGPLTPTDVEELPPEIAAVCHVLRDRAADEQYRQEDLNWILRNVNMPIDDIEVSPDRRLNQWGKYHSRIITEYLLRYFDSLMWYGVQDTIGMCNSCRGLFLKIKTNQNSCSDTCRFRSLKAQGYWTHRRTRIKEREKVRTEKRHASKRQKAYLRRV